MAMTKGDLLEFSIGDELHASPADPLRTRHKHFYLKYAAPIQHRDSRYIPPPSWDHEPDSLP